MDRKIPGPPSRKYDQAAPIRAGKLRFPVTGPSALKKKGILGKSGNYFSKEAKEEFCLLLKVVSNKTGTNRYVPLVAEEKVIWTWDEDVYSNLEKYLKKEPEGMCRHTAAMVSKKDREIKNSHKGVCMRTECNDTLGLSDLIMTYLKKPLSSKARNERYNFILENFPPSKEIVLFDSALPEFKNKRLVIDGIQKKTMRHVLHSNGKQLWVFDIVFYSNSKLEEMKNMLRPLALNGKRKGTDRGFILKYVACDDKDTLKDWWKDIIYHTNGLSSEDYHAENNDECDVQGILKGLTFTNKLNESGERFALETHSMTVGEGTEAFIQSFESKLSMEDLMALLIQTENVTDSSKCLDSFILSGNAAGPEKLQVLVDPLNKADQVLDRYGNNTQRMLLQAVSKETLNTNLNLIPEFITNLSLFSFLKDLNVTTKSDTLKRYFDMEKSYVFNSEKEFCVSYLPTTESNYIGKLGADGAASSLYDQVILTVKQAEPKENVKSILVDNEQLTYINFNLVWEERRKKAVEAFRNSKAIPKDQFPYGVSNVKGLEEKQLVSYLFEGYRESALVALLELVQQVTDGFVRKASYKNDAVKLSFILQGLETLVQNAQSAFIIESAFFVQKQLLSFGISDKTQSNDIRNSACDTYLKLFKIVQSKFKFTLLPDFIIKDTLSFMAERFSAFVEIPSCVLELCKSFVDIGRAHKSTIHTVHATVVKGAIDHFVSELSTVEILLMGIEQKRALEKIEKAIAKKEVKTVSVPYLLEHDVKREVVVIKSTPFVTTKDDCFKLKKGKVTILASAAGIRNETSRVLAFLKVKNVYIDTGNKVIEKASVTKKFVSSSVKDFVKQVKELLTEDKMSVQTAYSILGQAKTSILTFENPVRSNVTVCAKADRSRLFGKAVESSSVGVNWGSELLKNVDAGLKRFENAF